MADKQDDIQFSVAGGIGHVLLNRPRALNALSLDMVNAMDPELARWADDPAVQAVVIQGAGERAFCAGGDIRVLYDHRDQANGIKADFFRQEYRLNRRIKRFPKPYLAILDGTTMGGGVGLSVHGDYRVATERTLFAMPETGIGLFPDVGGGYFLPRCPGEIGMYLTLTGARLRAADCLYAGVATHFMPSARLPAFLDAVTGGGLEAALAAFAEDPGTAPLARFRALIDRCFSEDSVEAVIAALKDASKEASKDGADGWCDKTLDMMAGKSPTSQKISFRQVRTGATLAFEDNMIMEYRMSQGCMAGHDFYEGVRALLVDKDQAPKWSPATLAEVGPDIVEAHFAPLGARDLTFD